MPTQPTEITYLIVGTPLLYISKENHMEPLNNRKLTPPTMLIKRAWPLKRLDLPTFLALMSSTVSCGERGKKHKIVEQKNPGNKPSDDKNKLYPNITNVTDSSEISNAGYLVKLTGNTSECTGEEKIHSSSNVTISVIEDCEHTLGVQWGPLSEDESSLTAVYAESSETTVKPKADNKPSVTLVINDEGTEAIAKRKAEKEKEVSVNIEPTIKI